jgi:Protein of unknown function (DUF3551)
MCKLAMAGLITAAAALPLLGGTTQGRAAEGPWCHSFGGAQGGIENCSIQSLEMCRFEIQGNGGSCSPNPHYHGNPPPRRVAQPPGLYPWPWR